MPIHHGDAPTEQGALHRRCNVALLALVCGVGCNDVSVVPAGPSVQQLADLATLPDPQDPSRNVASFPSFLVSLGAERAAFVAFPIAASDPEPSPSDAPGTLYVTDGRTLHAVHTFEDYPHNLRAIGETLFFTAGDATTWGIWKTDGASVTLVKAIPKGADAAPGERNRAFDAVIGDRYCVSVWSSGVGAPGGVWATDGAPEHTVELATDLRGQLAVHGTELVVTPWFSGVGLDLFDLESGAHHTIATGPLGGPPPIDASGTLYVTTTSTDGAAMTLSRLDGTGLIPLHTFEAGRGASQAQAIEGRYFLVTAPADGPPDEVWTSDGTSEGTIRVFAAASISPGVAWDGGAMFGAADGLWWTQGDPDTTSLRVPAIDAHGLAVVDGRLLFGASDAAHGREPWISDGTPAGTRMIGDIAPGALGSNPQAFVAAGSRAVFAADDGKTGFEPWRFDPADE